MPEMYMMAGCNGAGKTTAAYTLLPEVFKTVQFVNADEIARGLSPFNVDSVAFQAGRIMLERINQLIKEQESFALETTLSGLAYLQLVKDAKAAGYEIIFFFVYLNSVALAKDRVAIRVGKGGHNIPADVIERRYEKGLKNFFVYSELSNDWYLYDNSGKAYELIAKSIAGQKEIANFNIYNKINFNEPF
jgi:predicted ABC-type ATPase